MIQKAQPITYKKTVLSSVLQTKPLFFKTAKGLIMSKIFAALMSIVLFGMLSITFGYLIAASLTGI
jgi:hypothetical protein